ncbi:hypothetical protein Pelo_4048 [Pelomyxa schiedti]|nr:hypothetical protein Pelo_4048 [Pelomyxa schiedti]
MRPVSRSEVEDHVGGSKYVEDVLSSKRGRVYVQFSSRGAANFARSHPRDFEGSIIRFLLNEEADAEEEVFGDARDGGDHEEEELCSDEEAYGMYLATTEQERQVAAQMLSVEEEEVEIAPTIVIKQEPDYLPPPPFEHRGPPVMFWKAKAGDECYTTSTEAETNCTTTTRTPGTVQVKTEPMNEDV